MSDPYSLAISGAVPVQKIITQPAYEFETSCKRTLAIDEFNRVQALLRTAFSPFDSFKMFLKVLVNDCMGQIESVQIKGSTVFKLIKGESDFTDIDLVIEPRAGDAGELYEALLEKLSTVVMNESGITYTAICVSSGAGEKPRYLIQIRHPQAAKCDFQVACKSEQSYTCTFDEPSIDITSSIIPERRGKVFLKSDKFSLEKCLQDWEERRFLPFIPKGDGSDQIELETYFGRSYRALFLFARLIGVKECIMGMEGLCEGFWNKWLRENQTNPVESWKKDLQDALKEVGKDPSKRMGLLLFLMHNISLPDEMAEIVRANWPEGAGPISGFVAGSRSLEEFRGKIDLLALRCKAPQLFDAHALDLNINHLSQESGVGRYSLEWGGERVVLNLPGEAKDYASSLFASVDTSPKYLEELQRLQWRGSPLCRELSSVCTRSVTSLLAERLQITEEVIIMGFEGNSSMSPGEWLLMTDSEMIHHLTKGWVEIAEKDPQRAIERLPELYGAGRSIRLNEVAQALARGIVDRGLVTPPDLLDRYLQPHLSESQRADFVENSVLNACRAGSPLAEQWSRRYLSSHKDSNRVFASRKLVQEILKAPLPPVNLINLLEGAKIDQDWLIANRGALKRVLGELYLSTGWDKWNSSVKNQFLLDVMIETFCDRVGKRSCRDVIGEIGTLKQLHKMASPEQKETIAKVLQSQLLAALSEASVEEFGIIAEAIKPFISKGFLDELVQKALERVMREGEESIREGIATALIKLSTGPFTSKSKSASELIAKLKAYLVKESSEEGLTHLPIPIIEAIASENELANLFIERLQSDLEKGNSQSVIFLLPIAMKNERILN
ncbi:MAG: hypothetical protein KDK40_03380, partial [Chlamydiia bacterium]|nr:hypothetical protein [Chlamydiia bacterium]